MSHVLATQQSMVRSTKPIHFRFNLLVCFMVNLFSDLGSGPHYAVVAWQIQSISIQINTLTKQLEEHHQTKSPV